MRRYRVGIGAAVRRGRGVDPAQEVARAGDGAAGGDGVVVGQRGVEEKVPCPVMAAEVERDGAGLGHPVGEEGFIVEGIGASDVAEHGQACAARRHPWRDAGQQDRPRHGGTVAPEPTQHEGAEGDARQHRVVRRGSKGSRGAVVQGGVADPVLEREGRVIGFGARTVVEVGKDDVMPVGAERAGERFLSAPEAEDRVKQEDGGHGRRFRVRSGDRLARGARS